MYMYESAAYTCVPTDHAVYVEVIVSVCGNDRQCYKRYIVQTTYVPYVKDIVTQMQYRLCGARSGSPQLALTPQYIYSNKRGDCMIQQTQPRPVSNHTY